MKTILSLTLILAFNSILGQVKATDAGIWFAKEYSKEAALFQSKEFLFEQVLNINQEVTKFEVIPLAAAMSGELTTLIYKCEVKNKEGLVLGFYSDYWNSNGIIYQGFGFKNLEKEKATEFLNKIHENIEANDKFLKEASDNNNVVFKFDDINVLIFRANGMLQIRLFWNGFDSTWERTAFDRSKRRFEKKSTK